MATATTAIGIEQIGTNRYAPEGANAVNLYAFNGVYDLTMAQLMMAICIRSACVIEDQSVLKMNQLCDSSAYLEVLAMCGERVIDKSSLDATLDLSKTNYTPKRVPEKTTYWDFMIEEVGLDKNQVPHTVSKTDDKTRVFGLLGDEIDKCASDNEQQSIDLESLLSRRDSTFNASASTIKNLGSTMNTVANNF